VRMHNVSVELRTLLMKRGGAAAATDRTAFVCSNAWLGGWESTRG